MWKSRVRSRIPWHVEEHVILTADSLAFYIIPFIVIESYPYAASRYTRSSLLKDHAISPATPIYTYNDHRS